MKHQDIFNIIESVYPATLAEKWDNVALQVGRLEEKTTAILLALDLSHEIIEQAVETGSNLIITHHPLDLKLSFPLDLDQPTGRLITALIKHDITHYAAHTNFDSGEPSVSNMILQNLGFSQKGVPLFPLKHTPDQGLGRGIVLTESIRYEDLLKRVETNLIPRGLRYIAPTEQIKKIAVLGGSGGSLIAEVAQQGYDCYITGDVKYHDARLAEALGLFTIDAGHFNTEVGSLQLLAQLLQNNALDIDITITKRERDPFAYMEVSP